MKVTNRELIAWEAYVQLLEGNHSYQLLQRKPQENPGTRVQS